MKHTGRELFRGFKGMLCLPRSAAPSVMSSTNIVRNLLHLRYGKCSLPKLSVAAAPRIVAETYRAGEGVGRARTEDPIYLHKVGPS